MKHKTERDQTFYEHEVPLLVCVCVHRPDNAQSNDWFAEKQNGILRKIRQMLQSNATDVEPDAVGQARRMYAACMDTCKCKSTMYVF